MSSRFFSKTETETISAAKLGFSWILRAREATKLFSLGFANGGLIPQDEKPVWAKIQEDLSESSEAGELLAFGYCSGYNDYVKRLSPPSILNKGKVLRVVIMGNPGDTVAFDYEASAGLEQVSTSEIDGDQKYWLVEDFDLADDLEDFVTLSHLDYDELILCVECQTNDLTYRIRAGFDGTKYSDIVAAKTITAAADLITTANNNDRFTEFYPYIQIGFKNAGAGNNATAIYVGYSIKRASYRR